MTRSIRSVLIAATVAAVAATAAAQPPPGGGPPGGGQPRQGGPGMRQGGPGAGTFEFMGAEIPLGPIVRGAPFSADGVTTSTQTLGDGTRISQSVNAKLYRDSEGRIRREQTVLGLGALAPSGEPQTIVTIVDPVAGVRYVLDSKKKAAFRVVTGAGFEARQAQGEIRRRLDGEPPPPPPPPPPGGGVMRGGPIPEGSARRGGPPPAGVANMPEQLGTKQIEGVNANGVKRTETIPAGRIGNDRPIVITDERWESPDLKMLVMSEHHDPRTGDVTYKLTRINRSEPDGVLFTVPSDYTISDAPPPPPPGGRGRGPGE